MQDEKRARGTAALLVVMLLWASTYAFTKVGLREVPPLTLGLLRGCFACGFLLAVTAAGGQWVALVRALRADLFLFCALGALGVAGFYTLMNLGVQHTSSGIAAVLVAASPFFILLLAALVLGERARVHGIAGAALGFVGVVMIFSGGSALAQAAGAPSLVGNVLALGAGLSWAVYTIVTKRAVERYGALILTTLAYLTGSCLLVPFAFLEGGPALLVHLTFASWAIILYLGVLGSGVSYLLWSYALTTMEAGRAGVFQFLSPVGALLIGMAFLHEPLTVWGAAGTALVLLGTFLAR